MSRQAERSRHTAETKVRVALELDGSGQASVATGVGFWDHLLITFAHHALFDLEVETHGDLDIDDHHTVEDTALVLGETLAAALGDRRGIVRFGDATVPMDEALARAAVDAGGRPYCSADLTLRSDRIGALNTQNLPHALEALARSAGLNVHVTATGTNDHHVAEAAWKALARALRAAVAPDPRRVGLPSTKQAL